jgi:hypothetical protein
MKKQPKTLVLHRETLLELTRPDIRSAVGGWGNSDLRDSCPEACYYSYNPPLATCGSGQQTCTTNLC